MEILGSLALASWRIVEMARATVRTWLSHLLSTSEQVLYIASFFFISKLWLWHAGTFIWKKSTLVCVLFYYCFLGFLGGELWCMFVFGRKGDTRKCSIQLWHGSAWSSQWKAHSPKSCEPPFLHSKLSNVWRILAEEFSGSLNFSVWTV